MTSANETALVSDFAKLKDIFGCFAIKQLPVQAGPMKLSINMASNYAV